jgi:hypothetical protein
MDTLGEHLHDVEARAGRHGFSDGRQDAHAGGVVPVVQDELQQIDVPARY